MRGNCQLRSARMALVVVAATVVGGGYGTCRALAQHAAAVNGTAAGSLLALCTAADDAVAALPARGADAAEYLSGVSVTEWRATIEASGRALALELVAQAVITTVLLLVRHSRHPAVAGRLALFADWTTDPLENSGWCAALELLRPALGAQPVGLVPESSLRSCAFSMRG